MSSNVQVGNFTCETLFQSFLAWRFYCLCTLAHLCCFLQKVDHHIATRWVDLLWSVAVDLHRWRRCQYLALWYPGIQHVFFFLSTVYVLWRITILTKCSWLICGDVWRCRVFKCYDFACIWWKPTMTAKIRNPGTLGSMRIEITSPVNSSRMDDRIPGHLIKQIMFWDFFYFILNSTLTTQFKTCLFFFLWHGPAKDLTKHSWIYETIIMNLESSLFQAMYSQ